VPEERLREYGRQMLEFARENQAKTHEQTAALPSQESAASKLHVSQPGISRQIHDLEDEIGFLLFERSGKSVRLTAAGKFFFGEARDILQRTDDAVKKARAGLASRAEIDGRLDVEIESLMTRKTGAFKPLPDQKSTRFSWSLHGRAAVLQLLFRTTGKRSRFRSHPRIVSAQLRACASCSGLSIS
jgi:hypothetical protein